MSLAINSYAVCASSICSSESSEPSPRFHGNTERSDVGYLQNRGAGALSLPGPAAVLALHTRSCRCAAVTVMYSSPQLPHRRAGREVCSPDSLRASSTWGTDRSSPRTGTVQTSARSPLPLHPSGGSAPCLARRSCACEPSDAVISLHLSMAPMGLSHRYDPDGKIGKAVSHRAIAQAALHCRRAEDAAAVSSSPSTTATEILSCLLANHC